MFDLENLKNKLQNLETNSINLSRIEIQKELSSVEGMSLHFCILRKGTHVYRARPNLGKELFLHKRDISYISEPSKVEEIKIGRANVEKQPIFYGSISSNEVKEGRVPAIFETACLSDIDFNTDYYMTIGQWELLEDIELFEIIFHDEAIAKNSYVREAFGNQVDNLRGLDKSRKEYAITLQKFLCSQFGRKTNCKENNSDKYKISASYAQVVYNLNVNGIVYPSVQTNFEGLNVALLPSVVKTSLKLKRVALQYIARTGVMNFNIVNVKMTDQVDDKGNIDWGRNLFQRHHQTHSIIL